MQLPDVRLRIGAATARVLAALYPEQQPFVFLAPRAWDRGGPDPVSGVSVFAHPDGHLHYVGFGVRDAAGLPFELTFRLAAAEGVPAWPVHLMNAFARHVIKVGRPPSRGHYLCLPEPVDPEGRVRCAALVPDPQLGAVDEPAWLQIVGLHEAELSVMSGDGYERLLSALAPLFLTRPGRAPLL